jgi:hypothetical protein
MIVQFSMVLIGPFEDVAVMAIMLDEPPIPLGVFEDMEEAELACHRFQIEQERKLN